MKWQLGFSFKFCLAYDHTAGICSLIRVYCQHFPVLHKGERQRGKKRESTFFFSRFLLIYKASLQSAVILD